MYANGAFKNPFADFDFSKFAGEFKFPVVPVETFVETSRKNFAALTTASTAAVESIKSIAQRQGDMVRAAMEDLSKHGSEVLAAATVEEKAAKQIDFAKKSYELAVANAKELAELYSKGQQLNRYPFDSVVAFVFFFGMLTAVEVFGAETKHNAEGAPAETTTAPAETATAQQTTTQPAVGQTSAQSTTTTPAKPAATKVPVSETEFKIVAGSTDLKAGEITFEVKNDGKLGHDLAIKETGDKTKLIPVGGTAELKVTLKAGKYELYCTVPGHEAAGMKLNITVS